MLKQAWKRNGELRTSTLLTRIFTLLLSVTLVFGILTWVLTVGEDLHTYEPTADDFFSCVEYGDYLWLGDLKQRTISDSLREEVAGCIAVSDYFEAAVFYQAYCKAGQETEAEKWKQDMESLLPTIEAYHLRFAVTEIHEKLGL